MGNDENDKRTVRLTIGELNLIVQNALQDAYGFLSKDHPNIMSALQVRYRIDAADPIKDNEPHELFI